MSDMVRDKIKLHAIKAGLEAGEFFLEYLPTVSLDDGRCIGAEALIRWRRPTGVVPPLEFIPIVENRPLSGLITYWRPVRKLVQSEIQYRLADWDRVGHLDRLGPDGQEHDVMQEASIEGEEKRGQVKILGRAAH